MKGPTEILGRILDKNGRVVVTALCQELIDAQTENRSLLVALRRVRNLLQHDDADVGAALACANEALAVSDGGESTVRKYTGPVTDKLKELMSRCKCGVHVTVNAHRDVYESAEIFLSEMSTQGGHEDLEIDPAVKAKMIETNTVVEVQFYPNTPVSFYVLRHYDLDAALDEALARFQPVAAVE